VLSEAGRWMAVGWDQRKHCAGWCGLHIGVVVEGGELGSLRAAAAGVPRQGAGWHEVGFSASTVMSGAECATLWLLRGADGAVWGIEAGVLRQVGGWRAVG
jgi:hypothetical protein